MGGVAGMYLHLGQDVVVRHQDILGIFDLDNASVSRITRLYLSAAQKKRQRRHRDQRAAQVLCGHRGKGECDGLYFPDLLHHPEKAVSDPVFMRKVDYFCGVPGLFWSGVSFFGGFIVEQNRISLPKTTTKTRSGIGRSGGGAQTPGNVYWVHQY